MKDRHVSAAPADGRNVKAAPAPVRVVNILAARTDTPAADGRTLVRPRLDRPTVPVFVQRDKGRDLVGTAELEATGEGVEARLTVAPYVANALESRELHAHVETVGGDVGQDPLIIHGATVMAVYCSKAAPAWNDLWVVEE